MKTIAVDAMGGDHAPEAIVEGAIDAARELSIPVTLVGDRERITRELNRHRVGDLPVLVHNASQVVEMDDSPVESLRRKRDSSIRVGFHLVKTGDADAFISAGNSGAMMAAAVMLLGNLPGVDRPAIGQEIPSRRGHVTLLDAGANVECAPLNLVQFAVMGDVFARSVRGLLAPRIGIISNGEEANKGTELTRAADRSLRQMPLNYVGYIEGRDLNAGNVDVAVTDGFTGNAILKSLEGLGSFVQFLLRQMFERNLKTKIAYLLLKKDLDRIRKVLDYDAVGGAPLLGVNGVTVIAHGSSGPKAIKNAIRVAAGAARKNLIAQIAGGLRSVPEIEEVPGASPRRTRFWQQLKGRFRRDGKADRNGDARTEGPEETDVNEAQEPPKRE
ncbi:MAG TPA: phosphate acyltransferase PlsX [Candidatus Binatia bacterium]|nr:phosphate acyltransferase PlsX [Candidatus Binatia bacterium]